MSAHTLTQSRLSSARARLPDFILPASFQPADLLPSRLLMRSDDARWIISTIVRKTANRDLDIWGCARLHSQHLRRVMGKNHSAVIHALKDAGAIEVAGYSAGAKSTGYRLAARYLGDRCVRVRPTCPKLIARLRDQQDEQHDEQQRRRLPIHDHLRAEQYRISLAPEADGLIDTLPEHTRLCQSVLVDRIRRREFSFSVSSTGRVFNAISGLKRELRAHLLFSGEPVGSVDIVNCQPALLANLCHNTPTEVVKGGATYKVPSSSPALLLPPVPTALPACPGSDSFFGVATSGHLYEVLAKVSGLSRDEVKRRFLVDVLAKRGRYPSEVEATFRRLWPEVYQFIRKVNRDDHSALIRLLQRAESSVVVEQVAPHLLSEGLKVQTLHDAVFGQRRHLADVEHGFVDVLKTIGVTLSLKMEQ